MGPRYVTSVQRSYLFVHGVNSVNGAHAVISPEVNYEADVPTITGWRVRFYAGWREGGGPQLRHTIRVAEYEEALAAGRTYLKALVELPDDEVISLEPDQFASRPPVEHTEEPDERWWDRFAS